MKNKRDAASGIYFLPLILAVCFFFPANISAQYFGRNKIQYENFHFAVLETAHFSIYYYPEEKRAAEDAALMAERWYDRYSDLFGRDLKNKQPLIIYANSADFQQTNVIQEVIEQGVGGVTESLLDRIVLPLTGDYAENNHVIGHELVHAFQYDIMNQRKGLSQQEYMPLWLIEGMAEFLSLGRENALTAMWMRDAVLYNDLPSMHQLASDPAKYFPYRYGHALWAYIAGKWGDQAVPDLFNAVLVRGWNKGFENVLGTSPDSLDLEWKQATVDKFKPEMEGRTPPDSAGKLIIEGHKKMNLSPVISPDGNYIALISQKDVFTLNLYLADARTGEIIRELANSNTDAHFDALRFINSAGTWSPDSKKFAFIVYERGDNRIEIADIKSGKIERELGIDKLDDISHIAWSPDGSRIAVAGTYGGISNLYLYDLKQKKAEQLTDDLYFEMQPAWSPDGKTLAFVTDRGPETDFKEMSFETVGIGLMDLDSREISVMRISNEAKHINPQFSSDGNDLYFVSDPDGFSDLYRYSFMNQSYYRITRIATGISGLTELSSAMSLAGETGEAIFTVFQDADYYVYGIDVLADSGELLASDPDSVLSSNIMLPPETEKSTISEYLKAKKKGLASEKNFSNANYSSALHLVYVGQPVVVASVDRFGTSLGGAVSFALSDMLGNHWLLINGQVNGSYKDLGGQVIYQNESHRMNWGAGISHIPYLTADFYQSTDTATVNGEIVQADKLELIRQRVYVSRASFLANYPLSINRRIEFTTGYTHVGYSSESEQVLIVDNMVYSDNTVSIPSPKGLHLAQTALAYVGDYSFTGFTSPVRGKSFRFEIEPTFGTLDYLTVLADYRQYFYISPLTLAFRGYHLGRYLKDSESNRLSQYFLGYETMVRGYPLGSFDVSECTSIGDSIVCPEIDRLIGSRIAVFNAELRLPLLGNQQFGLINFSYLPTELALFFDGGVAWSRGQGAELKWAIHSNKRIPVFSTGIAMRFNFFGYIVAQIYLAHPFQRPGKSTQFGFVIAPGW